MNYKNVLILNTVFVATILMGSQQNQNSDSNKVSNNRLIVSFHEWLWWHMIREEQNERMEELANFPVSKDVYTGRPSPQESWERATSFIHVVDLEQEQRIDSHSVDKSIVASVLMQDQQVDRQFENGSIIVLPVLIEEQKIDHQSADKPVGMPILEQAFENREEHKKSKQWSCWDYLWCCWCLSSNNVADGDLISKPVEKSKNPLDPKQEEGLENGSLQEMLPGDNPPEEVSPFVISWVKEQQLRLSEKLEKKK